MPFAASRIHDIMLLLMLYPRFCIYLRFAFFPSSAAVCAQHIRRLPKGCRACRTVIHFILSVPASKLNASELGFRFLPPRPSPILLFLPPDPHIPPHFVRNLLLRPQNAIFKPSKNRLIFCFHFLWKKSRKSWILASQNASKTVPKSIQNRWSQKHTIFHRFLLIFCCLLQEPNLKFHAPTQCFVSFSQQSSVRFWPACLVQKTYQKPFQNEARTL